ncbi:hypothetical protein [Mycolicibacterium sp.]|uniref:hypothetical protein n=1 Tax=Mycolicibacterium sp. TaxID=2320850 RepID=UPI00355E6ABA
MAMTWHNQHDTLPEELFELQTLEDLQSLQTELVEIAGVTPAVATRIPMWVAERAAGRTDVTGPNTRARYRKALARVLEHRPDGPGRSRRPRSDEGGFGHLSVVAGVGIAAGAALSGANPAMLAMVGYYFTEHAIPGDEVEDAPEIMLAAA